MNQHDNLIAALTINDKQQDIFSKGNAMLQEKLSRQEIDCEDITTEKPNYQEQIQVLVHQLKINEEHHAKVLKEYQSILADKDRLVEEKKQALERIHDAHSKRMEQLIRTQQQALRSCQVQHNLEIAKLEQKLQQLETEAKGVAVEQLLNNFEQEQHAFPVDCIPNIPITISSPSSSTSYDPKNAVTNKPSTYKSSPWSSKPSPLLSLRK